MMVTDSRFRLNEDVVFQSLVDGQETVVVSLGSGFIYSCNDTTRAFLEALDGDKTLPEIASQLVGEFMTTEDKLLSDLSQLAEKMLAEGLISVVNEKCS